MKLFINPDRIRQTAAKAVVTIGNFDGMHRGHQQLIDKTIALAKQHQAQSLLVTFHPHPREFFAGRESVARLMRMREKFMAVQDSGLDAILALHFNQALAAESAEDFVKNILVDQLNVQAVVVGDDFRFGAKRAGDFALLQQLGKQYGFTAIQVPGVMHDNQRISSTWVREALQQGDLTLAETLLGHPYYLCGKVAYGAQRGRQLGFPTANIHLHRHLVPLKGVYAVRVFGIDDHPLSGVANVGIRPTVDGTRVLLEVFIFDFNRTVYGANMTVEFVQKIRDEEKYDSLDALKAQIDKDVLAVKDYFNC